MDAPPPPRRNWHLTRWLIVFGLLAMTWSGWRAYAFRSALAEAEALEWEVEYTDPVESIRANWKSAFNKGTWLDGVTRMYMPTSESLEVHSAIVHRLNPKELVIEDASTLRNLSALTPLDRLEIVSLSNATGLTNVDALNYLSALQKVSLLDCTGLTNLDALKNLSALQELDLNGCTGLTNVDTLKNLSALQSVWLTGCAGLTNVDALKNLSALQEITLHGCTGLTKESVAALKAALPSANIFSDYR